MRECRICKMEIPDNMAYCNTCLKGNAKPYYKEPEESDARKEMFRRVFPDLFWEANLSDLSEPLQNVLKSLSTRENLYLWGNPGVGKSHTMAVLAKLKISRGEVVKRLTMKDLKLTIEAAYHSSETIESLLSPYIQCQNLILEDVGVANNRETDATIDNLLYVLDKRIERCLPIFLTSNRSPQSLGDVYDARIRSRVSGFVIVEITGPDRRSRLPKKGG